MRPAMLLLAVCLLAGCGGNPFFRARSQLPQGFAFASVDALAEPLRIAVMPNETATGVGRSGQGFAEHLAAALRARGGHEIVLVPPDARDAVPRDAVERGRLPSSALLRLGERLGVDAVLLSRVEQLEPYAPLSAGFAIQLVSCMDGTVLWSVTAQVDSSESQVQEDMQAWWRDRQGEATDSIAGWRIATQSPREFLRYLADRAASTCAPPPAPDPVKR